MTTALCLNCGETKLGALCPCSACNAPATGDHSLDILFCDHQITVPTLRRLGDVIKQIHAETGDPDIAFWAFISYMSAHPSDLLKAEPPDEIASSVKSLYGSLDLPMVEIEMKEIVDHSPPMRDSKLPAQLFQAFDNKYGFPGIAAVQVIDFSETIERGIVTKGRDGITLSVNESSAIDTANLKAIRKMPGCLFGWLIKPPWLGEHD